MAYRRPDDDELPQGYDDMGFASGFFGGQEATPAGTALSPLSAGLFGGSTPPREAASAATPKQPAGAPPPSGSPSFADALFDSGGPDDRAYYGGSATFNERGAAAPGTRALADTPDAMARYRDQVSQLQQIADPAERARARDSLARTVYGDLQRGGHDVAWDGDTLVVDGRRYTIAGGQQSPSDLLREAGQRGTTGGMDTGVGQTIDTRPPVPGQPAAGAGAGFVSGATPFTGQQGPNAMRGLVTDRAFAATDTNSVKDAFTRAAAGVQTDIRGLSKEQLEEVARRELVPLLEAQGVKVHDIVGDQILIETAEEGLVWKDYAYQAGAGDAAFHWEDVGGPAAGGPAMVNGGGLLPAGPGAPGAAGTPTGTGAPAPGGPGGPVEVLPGPGGTPAAKGPDFMTGPGYTPGEIPLDDIPGLAYEDLLGSMGRYTPETYEVGDMGVGPLETDVESLLASILRNPESLDARTVAQMKAGNREEQADLLRQANEELTGLGYEYGIESSPWLASERLTERARRDETVQRGNRAVEMQAAATNAADRRAATQLGDSYLTNKGGRKRGEEALRQSASALNESNRFNAARLQSDNVAAAAKHSLDAAAARGDRMALRESVAQEAASLGISRDKLMTDYVVAMMQDATDRYGIDVEALLRREGFAIDREKLAQAGREFKEDLAFRLLALAQEKELELTGIGLGYANLQRQTNRDSLDAALALLG